MLVGKVVGNLVSTQKLEKLVGYKLLLVELDEPRRTVVAVDTIGAGQGTTVLLVSGSSARAALGDDSAPVDAVVVGIVDLMERG